MPLIIDTKKITVLVAEDTHMNMLVISNMLKSILPNVTIIEAHNGIEAIQNIKNTLPDIILMDVQMPELDGLEATKQIRMLKNGMTLPIIALTAGVSKEERELCFDSGMNDFLSKPIEKLELKRIIEKFIANNKQNKNTINESEQIKVTAHFDREKLLAKIGDENVLKLLLDTAKTEYPKYIAEIEDVIEKASKSEIISKAHKLKGSALNMEFIGMGEMANAIENNVNEIETVKNYFNLLKNEWNEISNIL